MRLATIVDGGSTRAAVVRDGRLLPIALDDATLQSVRGIASAGPDGLERVRRWTDAQPDRGWRPLEAIELAAAVPDPGAIYTIGLNYRSADGADAPPERPLVYAKLPTSVAGDGSTLCWDRSLTQNVDPESELGVVIGDAAERVSRADAMGHVFGYTCIDDVSSRDAWLDGDQWLLGKSMPGFCPVGPWVVTADEVDASDLRVGCWINGVSIQDGSTRQMRFGVAELIEFLSRHVTLRPGDLIATGTPARLAGPLGPERHLEPGDVVTVRIERIGELTTMVA